MRGCREGGLFSYAAIAHAPQCTVALSQKIVRAVILGERVKAQVRLEDVPATALTAMGFVKRRFGDGYSLMNLVNGGELAPLRAITSWAAG